MCSEPVFVEFPHAALRRGLLLRRRRGYARVQVPPPPISTCWPTRCGRRMRLIATVEHSDAIRRRPRPLRQLRQARRRSLSFPRVRDAIGDREGEPRDASVAQHRPGAIAEGLRRYGSMRMSPTHFDCWDDPHSATRLGRAPLDVEIHGAASRQSSFNDLIRPNQE